jgi:hypothetical protein
METTTHAAAEDGPRRLRAAIIGLGLDTPPGGPQRIITGDQCLMVGGSAETHAELLETMLRLETELERLGRRLGDLSPEALAELAWRIDSPELHQIALRLHAGLRLRGRSFHESTPEELTDLAGS